MQKLTELYNYSLIEKEKNEIDIKFTTNPSVEKRISQNFLDHN